MYYLIEPYTMYQGKKKAKHWMQIAEEEALFYKQLIENQQIQQQAESNAPAAAGWPNFGYFNPPMEGFSFSVSPSITGSAPYTVYLNVNGARDAIRFNDFNWVFSDGTTATGATATKLFNTGSFQIGLTASTQYGGKLTLLTTTVTASLPVYVANFTGSVESGSVPLTVTFTNLTTINQYTGSVTGVSYVWNFGSASATSTQENPTVTYYQTGSYIVRLEATGSYGMLSSKAKFAVSAST